jgi:ornithine cyclodeaminase/alanine dehydrogenase
MPKTLVLTRRDVASLLTMEAAIPAVEAAFLAHARGEAVMPPKVYLSLPEHGGDFRAMPSFMGGAAGVKWVNSHPDNPKKHGLPSVMGTYVLNDAETAVPLAIMDGTWLTAVRTGAAGGVASKHLFRGQPKRVGFVGCGVQARVLHAAHAVLFGAFESLCADVSEDAAQRFAAEIGGLVVSASEASRADIVCVATPGRGPAVNNEDLRPGTHVNAMGADAPGKQEIDPKVLGHARVFIDDWEQATHSGEVNVPLHEGFFDRSSIAGTLGEVVAGTVKGRIRDEITLFDSTGLAVQDVAVARVVYAAAKERGVGLELSFVD